MNYVDVYNRALIDYRKSTTENSECTTQRGTTQRANAKDDTLTVLRKICTVETDWIEEIEKGLVHVDKAIREDRQFIRSNGEIIDIEKVKNVSKDSVEHLARHSNLITRYEEEKDIVPDRLYTVERLSDYAVYENRFLYMLLCYLRDFITVRYNKILDLEHTYNGSIAMKKEIVMQKRKIEFELLMKEERKDDEYLQRQSKSTNVISRIRDILQLTHAFLSTPLMQEVAKSPMLKPPVTKTNVLRMNHNFRGALALYEYVIAYDKDGYSVEEQIQKINPLRMDMADEFSEIALLTSFLTHKHGLNIKDELREEYLKEEERRKQEEAQRHLEQIKALRRRIKESGESPEEYMLLLEKRNRMLEKDSADLALAKEEIEGLNENIKTLEGEKSALIDDVARLNSDIERINEENEAQIAEINSEHQKRINEINQDHLNALREKDKDIISLKDEHRKEIDEINRENGERIYTMQKKWDKERELRDIEDEKRDEKISTLEKQYSEEKDSHRITKVRLDAIRADAGILIPSDDLTSEEAFMELEYELEAFKEFFDKQWKLTKKAIRKRAFKDFKNSLKIKNVTDKSVDEALSKEATEPKSKEKGEDNEKDKKE